MKQQENRLKTFRRVKVVKNKPKYNLNFKTSCPDEAAKLLKMKDKGYVITVIKTIEYSVSKYFKKTNQNLTIHSIAVESKDVIVTVFKNNDYHNITIPKSLLKTGNSLYEFSIGIKDQPQLEEYVCSESTRMFKHAVKKSVIYLATELM